MSLEELQKKAQYRERGIKLMNPIKSFH